MKIKKIKQAILKIKVLIIVLAVLVMSGWGLSIYLLTKPTPPPLTQGEKLEKIHSYATLLNESIRLAREEKSLDVLEREVRLLNNGTLLTEWQDVVFGGNRQEDLEAYFDVIVGALMFFSK